MLKSVIQRGIRSTGYDVIRAKAGHIYNRDGLYTNHSHHFISDPKFQAAYWRYVERTNGDARQCHGEWRVHIATWAAQNGLSRFGDFVECGVASGFVSSIVMTLTDWNHRCDDRRFFLIDNFEGVRQEQFSVEERRIQRGSKYVPYEAITEPRARQNLGEFRNTVVIKGDVPDILSEVKTDRIAYLHLDMNVALPEVAALKFFWPKIVPGAVVLMDDYAFYGYHTQREALDEAAKELGATIASLPTGQGLIIR